MLKWCQGERIDHLRQLILRLIGLMYAFAFASWYYQIPELYGKSGLLPIERLTNHYIHNETLLTAICIIGTLLGLAIFISHKFVTWYAFSIIWAMYLAVYYVGQEFSQFQWDILLIECGFICIIFCLSKMLGRELLRWLAFRLYFSSGVIKLLSQCPTWWNLTALHYHFASQCIPHFLSWWAHQLPSEIKKFMVAGNFYVLIFGAIYFYFPWRPVRIFGFLLQCTMQIAIILTGNYNFFNFLSIILAMVVLDDGFIAKWVTKEDKDKQQNKRRLWVIPLCLYATGVIMYNVFYPTIMENRKLPFTVEDLSQFLHNYLSYFLLYVLSFFFFELTYYNMQKNAESNRGALKSISTTLANIAVFIVMFSMSNMSFQQGLGIREIDSPLIPQENLYQIKGYTNNFRLFNSYGLFMRMTGVNGRPELIFQGSQDGNTWTEYEFHYKPGRLDEISPLVIPHQPRLDWQLWFAAFQESPRDLYLVHLIYKILDGQNVEAFIKNPPIKKPPKYLRIQKYLYYYTNVTEMVETGRYWKRVYSSEYLPPTTLTELRELNFKYEFFKAKNEQPPEIKIPFWAIILSAIIYKIFS